MGSCQKTVQMYKKHRNVRNNKDGCHGLLNIILPRTDTKSLVKFLKMHYLVTRTYQKQSTNKNVNKNILNSTLMAYIRCTYPGVLEVAAGHSPYMITAVVACNTYGVSCLVAALVPRGTLDATAKDVSSATSVPVGTTNAAYILRKHGKKRSCNCDRHITRK